MFANGLPDPLPCWIFGWDYKTLNQNDLTNLHLLQDTELVAAGFPCIDVSRAGLRRGLSGQVGEHHARMETT
jgi:site-specific DNA-cytosine methylase